jgi:hypothetical protein
MAGKVIRVGVILSLTDMKGHTAKALMYPIPIHLASHKRPSAAVLKSEVNEK